MPASFSGDRYHVSARRTSGPHRTQPVGLESRRSASLFRQLRKPIPMGIRTSRGVRARRRAADRFGIRCSMFDIRHSPLHRRRRARYTVVGHMATGDPEAVRTRALRRERDMSIRFISKLERPPGRRLRPGPAGRGRSMNRTRRCNGRVSLMPSDETNDHHIRVYELCVPGYPTHCRDALGCAEVHEHGATVRAGEGGPSNGGTNR